MHVDCDAQRRDDVVVAGSQGYSGTLAVPRPKEPASSSKHHRGLRTVRIERNARGGSMFSKKPVRRVSHAWAKEDLEVSGNEPTLVGREQQNELVNAPVFSLVEREQSNLHKLQNRALIGLGLVLLEVLTIVMTVIICVANLWLEAGFAEIMVITTVPPSIGAWMFVVKWMFPTKE